jgi:phenylpropionate dioxygenase-like ring-hydroxylating dioxygenase large terminal subunit
VLVNDVVRSEAQNTPLWAKGLRSPEGFREEQAEIGKLWNLVGLTTDLAKDGDWFRSSLGGKSIFVQRFEDELRGFENICVHRFYPIRTEVKGNGAIRCGFHHWQYNKDGLALGIPNCQEMFGVIPRELGAKLRPVEIATCGILVFARFPSGDHQQSLRDYLGAGYDILAAMWGLQSAPYVEQTEIKANWKLGHHISLDDYHIVAVHPETFGKNGYLPLDVVKYYRFGRHSAYFYDAEGPANGPALENMARACRDGTYRPDSYRILQFFPNLVCVHFSAGLTYYVLIQHYVPVAHNRTILRSIYAEAPFPPTDANFLQGLARRIARPFVPFVMPYYMHKIVQEDNDVCEHLQTIADQIDRPQVLGKHEERIVWFEENYAEIVGKKR